MKKKPVEATVSELKEILSRYIDTGTSINYALKIVGHPGVGKSAVVKEVADEKNYYFIDTRLAFKENIDLGGYPVPDHESKRMVYYRPRFIPPETVPENYNGIVWFLDEANRAHPTVIQTLFQIITEKRCGEHELPENTSIILAGNLGEEDATTITDFDDAALDGRLAIIHLKPDAADWLKWADENGIHRSITRYISAYPEKLWDEYQVNPNPRGWDQVSKAIKLSYGLDTPDALTAHLGSEPDSTLTKIIFSLAGYTAGDDFIRQISAPRAITTTDILEGRTEKLSELKNGKIPAEDILWALYGAIEVLKDMNSAAEGDLSENELKTVGNFLQYASFARGDIRSSFLFLLLKECGIFTSAAKAAKSVSDSKTRAAILKNIEEFITP